MEDLQYSLLKEGRQFRIERVQARRRLLFKKRENIHVSLNATDFCIEQVNREIITDIPVFFQNMSAITSSQTMFLFPPSCVLPSASLECQVVDAILCFITFCCWYKCSLSYQAIIGSGIF